MANDINVPGFTATPELQAKLDSLDDNLDPVTKDLKEGTKDEPREDETASEEEDEAVEAVEETEEGNESEETAEDSEDSDDKETDEAEGYTIDEGDEEEKSEAEPTTSTQANPNQLTAEQQYVLDNIGTFKVRGTVPGSDKVEAFDIYTIEQLPAGFKYESETELALAMKRDNYNEQRAENLLNDFRGQETRKAAAEFKVREDNADRQDIGNLQREGELPRFTKEPNAKDFDSDPAVELVNNILKFKEDQNQKYLEEYNAGRPYKHIGFEEAFRMYKYQNPDKMDVELKKEDEARKSLAKRTTKAKGTSSQEPQKQRTVMRSSRDLDNLIESLDW